MLKTLALAACLCVVLADPVEQAIYPGRTGDVVLTKAAEPAHLVLVGAQSGPSAMDETSVAPLLAHTAGAMPTVFPAALPEGLGFSFDAAPALLTIALEGVTVAQARASLPGIAALISGGHSVKLDASFEPRDRVAAAVSRVTGASPADHGIAAKAWLDHKTREVVSAFTPGSDATASRVAGVADVLGQTSQGRALLLSVSSDAQLAAANGPHPVLSRTAGATWPAAVVSYNAAEHIFKPQQVSDALDSRTFTVTLDEAATALEAVVPADAVEALRKDENAALVAELGTPLVLIDRIAADAALAALIGDSAADLVQVSLAALPAIGTDDAANAAAWALVDAAVPAIVASFESAWGTGARAHIVFAPSEAPVALAAPEGWTLLGSHAFHAGASAEAKLSGCAELSEAAEAAGARAHCLVHRKGGGGRRLQDEAPVDDVAPEGLIMTSDQVELYQVTLWTTIIIFTTLLFASCALYNMEVTQDSLLFSKEKGM